MATSTQNLTEPKALEKILLDMNRLQMEIAYIESQQRDLEEQKQEIQEEIKQLEAVNPRPEAAQKSEVSADELQISTDISLIEKKLKDAEKFVTRTKSADIPQDDRDELQDKLNYLRTTHSDIRRYLSSADHIRRQFLNTQTDLNNKIDSGARADELTRYQKELVNNKSLFEKIAVSIAESGTRFDVSYIDLISYESTEDVYLIHAEEEAKQKLEEVDLDKAIEQSPLSNSRENLDRIKVLMYADEYYRKYQDGQDLKLPDFFRLQNMGLYDTESRRVPADKFPEFFMALTGVDIKILELENDVKKRKMSEALTQEYIGRLSKKDKLALKKELEQKEKEDERERTLKDYLTKQEEEEKNEAKKSAKSRVKRGFGSAVASIDSSTDPYLMNPLLKKRSEEMGIAFSQMRGGDILGGAVNLTRLTDANPGPDIAGKIRSSVLDIGSRLGNTALDRVSQTNIGSRIGTLGLKVSTKVSDRTRFYRKLKRKAKGKGLFGFLLKWIIKKSVDVVVDTVKQGYKVVKNTGAVQRVSSSFTSSRVGQRLQAFATTTYKGAKSLVKIPMNIKDGIVTRAGNIYRVVDAKALTPIVKPAFRLIRDVGYIGSTSIRRMPASLIYGGAAGLIAFTAGAPILPVVIGATVFGNVLETVNSIMHTPTLGQRSFLVNWLQRQGSALYRDTTGNITQKFFNENANLRNQLGKTLNVYGGTGARLFAAGKAGLMWGLIAAGIAGALGINPLLAGAVTGLTVAGVHFASKTIIGARVAERLLAGTHMQGIASRLGGLSGNAIVMHVSNAKITNALAMELYDTLREGRPLDEFFKKNFSFAGQDWISMLNVLQNYIGLTGYAFATIPALGRFMGSRLIANGFAKDGLLTSSKTLVQSFAGQGFWGGLRSLLTTRAGLLTFLRVSVAPAAVVAIGSGLGLAIAALLGVNIAGLGATVGALVGTAVGIGVGTWLAGALAAGAVTGGIGAIPVLIVGFATTVFTALGAWVGSIFDKAVDGAVKGIFAVVGGISALFQLIDMFYNGLDFKNIVMFALSLALVLPAFSGVADKGSQSQSQADPTIERTTPEASKLNDNLTERYGIQFVQSTNSPVAYTEIEPLAQNIYNSGLIEDRKAVLVISDRLESNIYYNDKYIILNISIKELDPENKIQELLYSTTYEGTTNDNISLNY